MIFNICNKTTLKINLAGPGKFKHMWEVVNATFKKGRGRLSNWLTGGASGSQTTWSHLARKGGDASRPPQIVHLRFKTLRDSESASPAGAFPTGAPAHAHNKSWCSFRRERCTSHRVILPGASQTPVEQAFFFKQLSLHTCRLPRSTFLYTNLFIRVGRIFRVGAFLNRTSQFFPWRPCSATHGTTCFHSNYTGIWEGLSLSLFRIWGTWLCKISVCSMNLSDNASETAEVYPSFCLSHVAARSNCEKRHDLVGQGS